MNPVPDAALNGEWPDEIETLRRLQAFCCLGIHKVQVGAKWRWFDEEIRLDDERATSWRWWRLATRKQLRIRLWCDECNTVTYMIPKGNVRL